MLGRKALLSFLVNIVGALGGAIGMVAIGRLMGPESFGMVGFSLAAASTGGIVAKMGLDLAHQKRVSEGRNLATAIGTYLRLRAVTVTLYAALFVGAVTWWHRTQGFFDATTYTVMLAAGVAFIFTDLREVAVNTFRALQQTARVQTAVLVDHAVRLPGVVLIALLYGWSHGDWLPAAPTVGRLASALGIEGALAPATGALGILMAYAVAAAASVASGFFLMARYRYRPGHFDRELAGDYWRFARPAILVGVIGTLASQVDRLMLGYFWSATEVGYYFAAQRVVSLIQVIPGAVAAIFFPLLSELAARGDRDGVPIVARSTQRLLGLLVIGAALPFVAFPRAVLHILVGDGFLPAANVLRVLGLFVVVGALGMVNRSILLGFDRPATVARGAAIAAISNIVLNAILIPDSLLGVDLPGLRALGAATATLASQSLGFAYMAFSVRRHAGVWVVQWATALQVVAAVVAVAVVTTATVTDALGGIDRVWELGLAGLTVGVLYLAGLVLVRQVGRHEIVQFWDLIHPIRMINYVRSEMRSNPEEPSK